MTHQLFASFNIRGTFSSLQSHDISRQSQQGRSDGPVTTGTAHRRRTRRRTRTAHPGNLQSRFRACRDRSARRADRRQRRHSRVGARPHLGATIEPPLHAGLAESARAGTARALDAHASPRGRGLAGRGQDQERPLGPRLDGHRGDLRRAGAGRRRRHVSGSRIGIDAGHPRPIHQPRSGSGFLGNGLRASAV